MSESGTISALEIFVFDQGRFSGSKMHGPSRVITIGSAADRAVVLQDPAVSPRHAIVYVQRDKVFVADDGGQGGVRVNGRSVTQAEISGFDEVELGDSRIKIEVVLAEDNDSLPPISHQPSPKVPSRGSVPPPPPPATPSSAIELADDLALGFEAEDFADTASQEPTRAAPRHPGLALGEEAGFAVAMEARESFAVIAPPPPPPMQAEEPTHASGRGDPPTVPSGIPIQADLGTALIGRQRRSGPIPTGGLAEEPTPIDPIPSPAPPPVRVEAPAPYPIESIEAPELATEAVAPEPLPQLQIKTTPSTPPAPMVGEALSASPPSLALMDHLDHDELELEEMAFEPSFSLLENVVRERFESPIQGESKVCAEVIIYRDHRLLSVERLERGAAKRVFDPNTGRSQEMFAVRRRGRVRLSFGDETSGSVVIGGHTASLKRLRAEETVSKRGMYGVDLAEGDFAHVRHHGVGYLLRFVRSPAPPPRRLAPRLGREETTHFGLGILGIIFLLVAIWVEALVAPKDLQAMEEEVQFAEVSLKELQLEKPEKPPPPPPPPPPAPPAEVEPEPEPVKPKKVKRRRASKKRRRRARPQAAQPDPAEQQAAQAMAALASVGPTRKRGLSKTVSNIASVRAPRGSSKRFRVEGAIGKLPGNEVSLAVNRRGRDTRSAAALLDNAKVGSLKRRSGGGRVRGKVKKMPARTVSRTGGVLSRSAILKVINAGIGDIQRCYERELMRSPGLAGKIVFDWVIATNGSVTSARVRSATLKSQTVSKCIANVIKGWQFPKPRGGSVKVKYPFIFQVQGF